MRSVADSRPTFGRGAAHIDDFLVDVPDEHRPALRAELEALERELRPGGRPRNGCRAPDGTESFHDRRGADYRP